MSVVGHERGGRAARERVLDEVDAAADRDEEVAFRDAARVDLQSRDGVRPRPRDQPAERLDHIELERDHWLSTSRATARSSNGTKLSADLHLRVGPLAGDHDDVSLVRLSECPGDRRAAIDDDLQLAVGDLLGDRLRVLAARVVGRDDRAVGTRCGDTPHQRPLLAVAVPACPEDDGQAAGTELARGPQDVVERVGSVGVVDDDAERLSRLDGLEPAGHAGDGPEALPNRSLVDAEDAGRCDGPRGVLTVEAAAQPQLVADVVAAGERDRAGQR